MITRADASLDRTFTPTERAAYGVAAGPLVALSGGFANLARTKTSGVDIGANARFDTPVGAMALRTNVVYLSTFYIYSPPRGGYGDNIAQQMGRVRGDISAVVTRGAFTHGLTWYYESGKPLHGDYFDTEYTLAGCKKIGWTEDQCRIGSLHYWNYNFAYAEAKGPALGLNIRNVFNTRTPVNLRGIREGGLNLIPQDISDVRGRMLRLTVEYKFW